MRMSPKHAFALERFVMAAFTAVVAAAAAFTAYAAATMSVTNMNALEGCDGCPRQQARSALEKHSSYRHGFLRHG